MTQGKVNKWTPQNKPKVKGGLQPSKQNPTVIQNHPWPSTEVHTWLTSAVWKVKKTVANLNPKHNLQYPSKNLQEEPKKTPCLWLPQAAQPQNRPDWTQVGEVY